MPDTPYRQFLDRVPDGFLLFDEQGGLLDANAQACASLGHHKAAMLGLGIMDLWLDPDGRPRDFWRDMVVDSQALLRGRLIRRDGSSLPAEIHVHCLSLSGRRLFFTTWHDLSERTGQDEQIGQPNAQLEPHLQNRT